MTDREKLSDLLYEASRKADSERYIFDQIADHLIANGVIIQKEAKLYWKPVEKGVWNLTCYACDSHLGCREDAKHCPECGAKFVKPQALSPKLPEEEDNA